MPAFYAAPAGGDSDDPAAQHQPPHRDHDHQAIERQPGLGAAAVARRGEQHADRGDDRAHRGERDQEPVAPAEQRNERDDHPDHRDDAPQQADQSHVPLQQGVASLMAPVACDCKWWPAWNRGGAPPPPGREAAPRRAPRQVCAGEALAPYLPLFDFAAQLAIASAWGPDTRPLASSRRSEEHTSELQSLMRISYAVFCLKKKKNNTESYEQHKS